MDNKLIVIAGPTASGKTSLSVGLAKQLNCPIISADSRQFYKELSIGTAKPTNEEMDGVKHYFINSHSIETPLSAGQFEKEGLLLLEKLFKTHKQIILVGGSGMFIKALTEGTDQFPHDPEVRKYWNEKFENKGLPYLQQQLKNKDPNYFSSIDQNNPVRLIRALEIIELLNKPISEIEKSQEIKRDFDTHYFIINHDRALLYERINQRVNQMIESGLLDEVKSLEGKKHLQPLNTVGYKELFEYLDGKTTFEEAIDLIKRNTRRYAKRQLTWFRSIENAKWLTYSSNDLMIKEVLIKTTV